MRLALVAAAVFVAAYAVMALVVYAFQDRLLYFPFRDLEATPAALGLAYEDVRLPTADGQFIAGWWVPAAGTERAVLLYCHGNAGNISHRLDMLRILHGLGLSVLIFDYRGYGHSSGSPSERGTYLDGEAAWGYVVDVLKRRPRTVILFGESLGAAVAVELASRHGGAGGLIIQAGFTSLPELAADLYPFLPARLLTKYRYDSIGKLRSVAVPALIVHSPDDEIIPFAHGKALYGAAAGPKQLLQIRGGHNEGFLVSGDLYVRGLEAFLDRVAPR
jgi:hypothetical protein